MNPNLCPSQIFGLGSGKNPARAELKRDLLVSLAYTALIVGLIKLGVLKPIEGYFK